MRQFTVELDVEILAESEEAIKVQVSDTEEPVWLPRSQIDERLSELNPYKCQAGDQGTLYIPEWLATNKGLI